MGPVFSMNAGFFWRLRMSSVHSNGTGTYRVQTDNGAYLGIATGLNNAVLKTVNESDFLSVPGISWSGTETVSWPLINIAVQDNEIIPYGEWREGKTLADSSPDTGMLLDTARFFQNLLVSNRVPGKIPATGLYYTGEHEIILFPEYVLDLIASHQDDTYTVQFIDTYNHPELQGEQALCFTLGVMAYKMITGKFPFFERDSTTMRESIRRKEPLPPDYTVPGVRKDFSELILSSIKPSSQGAASLSVWVDMLISVQRTGYIKKVDRTAAERLLKEGESRSKKNERSFRRKLFFARNWKLIAGIAAGVLFAGIVLSAPLRKILSPPVTKGFPAIQVVRLYYESINKLDTETMSTCVKGGAGKDDIKEATGIFVISRVRTGYEGKSGFILARDWLQKGSPPLKPGETIYGITGLSVIRLSDSTFQADYTKWTTEIPSNSAGKVVSGKPVRTHITDLLHLVRKRGTWFIDSIRRSKTSD